MYGLEGWHITQQQVISNIMGTFPGHRPWRTSYNHDVKMKKCRGTPRPGFGEKTVKDSSSTWVHMTTSQEMHGCTEYETSSGSTGWT